MSYVKKDRRMELSLGIILIAIFGGFIAGIINTLAGNGSAITLTIFTELLGLPGNIANGTNRVGILAQGLTGSYTFYKHDKLNLAHSKHIVVLVFLGAIAGVIAAINISNEAFMFVFKYLLILMLIVVLIKPKRWLIVTDQDRKMPLYFSAPLFLALGFYGGFIQMGMGVFFLAIMVLVAKYNIIDANAIKGFVVLLYTVVVIAIFQYKGLVDWKMGAIVAIGQAAGGYFAAHYSSTVKSADIWAYRLLIFIIIAAIIRTFNLHTYLGF